MVSPQVEGEKAELVERHREAESERASWRGEVAGLQQQLGDLGAVKLTLDAAQGFQKEALERLGEELGQMEPENAKLLEQFAQVRGEATHTTLHTLLVCTHTTLHT